jgi:hypothetical protein
MSEPPDPLDRINQILRSLRGESSPKPEQAPDLPGGPDLLGDDDKMQDIANVRDALRGLLKSARAFDRRNSDQRSSPSSCEADTRRFVVILAGSIIGGRGRKLKHKDRLCLEQILGFEIAPAEFDAACKQLRASAEEVGGVLPMLLQLQVQEESERPDRPAILESSNGTIREIETVVRHTASVFGARYVKASSLARRIGFRLRDLVDAEKARLEDEAGRMNLSPTEREGPEIARENLEEVKAELMALIGLDAVKKDVLSLSNLLRVRKLRREAGPAPTRCRCTWSLPATREPAKRRWPGCSPAFTTPSAFFPRGTLSRSTGPGSWANISAAPP